MNLEFTSAADVQSWGRVLFSGPPKAGKTLTGLMLAFALSPKVCVIDTENRSSAKHRIWPGMGPFELIDMPDYQPETFMEALRMCDKNDFGAVLLDSSSHAWEGIVEKVNKSGEKGPFGGWTKIGTPAQQELMRVMGSVQYHLICTVREKTDWIFVKDRQGNDMAKKAGMKLNQREGIEYEFDLVCEMTDGHDVIVKHSRCSAMDRQRLHAPTAAFFAPYISWLKGAETRRPGDAGVRTTDPPGKPAAEQPTGGQPAAEGKAQTQAAGREGEKDPTADFDEETRNTWTAFCNECGHQRKRLGADAYAVVLEEFDPPLASGQELVDHPKETWNKLLRALRTAKPMPKGEGS